MCNFANSILQIEKISSIFASEFGQTVQSLWKEEPQIGMDFALSLLYKGTK